MDGYDNDYYGYMADNNYGPTSNALPRYLQYKKMYTNCTYVDGNLEIVFLRGIGNETFNLDFLSNIREVTRTIDPCVSLKMSEIGNWCLRN